MLLLSSQPVGEAPVGGHPVLSVGALTDVNSSHGMDESRPLLVVSLSICASLRQVRGSVYHVNQPATTCMSALLST